MDYLLFRLYAPLASWGEIAIGQTRHSAGYPGKSAIIGLLAASLGIKRSDDEKQQRLQTAYQVAVEVFSRGNLLRDYHTIQVPDSVGKFSYRTRRDELVIGKKRLGTILSTREYRTDSLAVIAIRKLDTSPYSLQEIQEYLLKPKFMLYLGRKSCPPAAPFNPQICRKKNSFHAAFAAYEQKNLLPVYEGMASRDPYWLNIGKSREYYWEGEAKDFSTTLDLAKMQTRIRHDQPTSRKHWQFAPRKEHYLYFEGGGA